MTLGRSTLLIYLFPFLYKSSCVPSLSHNSISVIAHNAQPIQKCISIPMCQPITFVSASYEMFFQKDRSFLGLQMELRPAASPDFRSKRPET